MINQKALERMAIRLEAGGIEIGQVLSILQIFETVTLYNKLNHNTQFLDVVDDDSLAAYVMRLQPAACKTLLEMSPEEFKNTPKSLISNVVSSVRNLLKLVQNR